MFQCEMGVFLGGAALGRVGRTIVHKLIFGFKRKHCTNNEQDIQDPGWHLFKTPKSPKLRLVALVPTPLCPTLSQALQAPFIKAEAPQLSTQISLSHSLLPLGLVGTHLLPQGATKGSWGWQSWSLICKWSNCSLITYVRIGIYNSNEAHT